MEYKYINLNYIENISDGDVKTKIQLIELFFTQVKDILQRFDNAIKQNDIQLISATAHLAKSSVKVMGISNIAEKMLELETTAKQNIKSENYNSLIEYFKQNIPFALTELNNELNILKQ